VLQPDPAESRRLADAGGIRALGWMLAMALLAVGAAVGFILARLAERRFPDDDLVLIGYAVNLVTLVGAVPSMAALMFGFERRCPK
jgi:hypothetical protein